jgi:chorismate dehydratase
VVVRRRKSLTPSPQPPPLRIARIHYLNTDPFFTDEPMEGATLVSVHPRELGRLAAAGKVDAGLLSLADLWNLEAYFEPLGAYGLAAEGAVRSVLLFSKKPPAELAGATIGVTEQTSTSVRLLQVLLASRYGLEARFRAGFRAGDDARLLIGDEALRARESGLKGFPRVADLAEEWHAWRGLPFVFARWAVRRTVPAYLKVDLAARLDAALRENRRRRTALATAGAKRLGLPAAVVRDYLDGFTYRLGEREDRAETAFRDLVTGKVPGCGC